MRRAASLIPVLSLALASSTGCPHEPAPGESVADVCIASNDGKDVAVSGYLMPPPITLGCSESCSMNLTVSKQEPYGIDIALPVGEGPRTMAGIEKMKGGARGEVRRLPTSAYRLTDDQGKDLGPGDVARVEGVLRASQSGATLHCSLDPTSIMGL